MQLGNEEDLLALGARNLLELLGSLLWATATHPEIDLYVFSWLCQFMSAPKLEHYALRHWACHPLVPTPHTTPWHAMDIGITYHLLGLAPAARGVLRCFVGAPAA